MPQTQAVFFRDIDDFEPVDAFIAGLPDRHAAKIDGFIEEHLNGRSPDAPPPPFPISSQIEGELRELRVRFADTRYRILSQRSANLVVLLHAFEKRTGSVPDTDKRIAEQRMAEFAARMDALPRIQPVPRVVTRRPLAAERLLNGCIEIDKLVNREL